jgi:hypothetical protein
MNAVRLLSGLAALCLGALLPAAAQAQAMAGTPVGHPLAVNKCAPTRNTQTYAGYTPGYYPYGNRYWGWPSVYGPTYYQYPVQSRPTLAIDYSNQTSMVMKQIEFGLVVRGELVAEVKDVGTFSPGAEIKHEFGLSSNVFPLQTSYAKCVPLVIHFANGHVWKNPHLPTYKRSMYGPPPH